MTDLKLTITLTAKEAGRLQDILNKLDDGLDSRSDWGMCVKEMRRILFGDLVK